MEQIEDDKNPSPTLRVCTDRQDLSKALIKVPEHVPRNKTIRGYVRSFELSPRCGNFPFPRCKRLGVSDDQNTLGAQR